MGYEEAEGMKKELERLLSAAKTVVREAEQLNELDFNRSVSVRDLE